MTSSLEKRIIDSLVSALGTVGLGVDSVNNVVDGGSITLERPADRDHGDYSSNVALLYAKKAGMSPKDLAQKIVNAFGKVGGKAGDLKEVKKIEVAGPGFINFYLDDRYIALSALSIASGEKNDKKQKAAQKVMVEYTDPNPFKIFHIGHLMANAIGESVARIIESTGVKVIRACYQGDVGLHVAKTLWMARKNVAKWPKDAGDSVEKVKFLGEMYVEASKYDDDKEAQKEIVAINKKIFDRTDEDVNKLYDEGRKWSLEYFESIYRRLGTKFDRYFFESEVARDGVETVKEFLKKGVFEESEGAVIFPGERHGVHTRVFITSIGLPTYEAKELGLNRKKFDLEPDLSESVIVTANEQSDYFKVVLKAISLIYPDIAKKTKHVSHGIMRFASGKMSSRKGNIVPAEDLLGEIEALVRDRVKGRGYDDELSEEIVRDVSVSAVKYSILRSAVGGDIVYDPVTAVSFDGDSGPYLQYATVRARAVIAKAKEEGIKDFSPENLSAEVTMLERLIVRFPEAVEKSRASLSPHHIVTYLTELAGEYNKYYSLHKIVDPGSPDSPYRVAVTSVFVTVMERGLSLLGIRVPSKM